MSGTIIVATCRGGPLDGHIYKQTTTPPTRSGLFDYEGLGGVRGRYTLRGTEWRWEPAITGNLNRHEIALLALAAETDAITFKQVYNALWEPGYPDAPDRAWALLNKLRTQGGITHVSYGLWQITEKGRIALALARARPLAAPERPPGSSTTHKGIDLIPDPSQPEGTAFYAPIDHRMYGHLADKPPPTLPASPAAPPATGGETRSAGITDDAPGDTGAKTRDS